MFIVIEFTTESRTMLNRHLVWHRYLFTLWNSNYENNFRKTLQMKHACNLIHLPRALLVSPTPLFDSHHHSKLKYPQWNRTQFVFFTYFTRILAISQSRFPLVRIYLRRPAGPKLIYNFWTCFILYTKRWTHLNAIRIFYLRLSCIYSDATVGFM